MQNKRLILSSPAKIAARRLRLEKTLFLSFLLSMALLLTFCEGGSETDNTPSKYSTAIFAGSKAKFSGDGIGTAAGFASLCHMILNGDTLYTMDQGPHALRSIDKNTALVRTPVKGVAITRGVADTGGGSHADGAGDGTAKFNTPCGIAAANASTLYVVDTYNNRIRKITIGATPAATQVSTIAGTNSSGKTNGAGNVAQFSRPEGIAIIGNTLYVTDTAGIRTINIATKEVGNLDAKPEAGAIKWRDIAVNKTGTKLYVYVIFRNIAIWLSEA